jgi:hypothetical protein
MKALAVLLALLLFGARSVAALHPSIPTPGTTEGLGVNIHFTTPLEGEVEMIAAAGFRWVRTDLSWPATEREPGKYDFSKYDRLANALKTVGLRAWFILDYGHPRFASPGEKHPYTSRAGTAEFREAYAAWAAASAAHFAGRGCIFELWNEPNHANFWKPEPSVADYAAMALQAARAIKKAAPGECVAGPGCSGVDLKFLEGCFAAGLLEVIDAVSVHPYRESAPETAAEDYRALRALICRYAPENAVPFGSLVPDRPRATREIPILSGEWGYSTAAAHVDDAAQARNLARMFFTNLTHHVPLSIWYDWRDDGDNPKDNEHRFGLVRRAPTGDPKLPFEPKPAYLAARTLSEQLRGLHWNKEITPTASLDNPEGTGDIPGSPTFLFTDEKARTFVVAGWGTARADEPPLFASSGIFQQVDQSGAATDFTLKPGEPLPRFPKDELRYLRTTAPNDLLALVAAWRRFPAEAIVRGPAEIRIADRITNVLAHPLQLPCWAGAPDPIAPEKSVERMIVRSVDCQLWPRAKGVRLVLPNGGANASFHQPFRAVLLNPLDVEILPPGERVIPVLVKNPAGVAVHAALTLRGSAPVPEAPVVIPAGQTELLLKIPRPAGATFREAVVGELGKFPIPEISALTGWSREAIKLVPDGDRAVGSTQELAAAEPPDGPCPSETPSLRLNYSMDSGWKFLQLRAGNSVAPLARLPRRYGLWIYGDAQGATPAVRFRDASGQTFQFRGEPITWKGWRFVTFDFADPAGVDSATPGALYRRHLGYWGGANDGTARLPITWDTYLLIDSGKKAMRGTLYFSAPSIME